tara:strand:- start:4452 stop:5660 length:1209 start_codon:yes stop_codon:yes gene_type:complete
MQPLKSKNILIGVSGGIAAYKIPIFIRQLKNAGANVKVILTESAKDFVTPLTLEVLSQNSVLSSFVSEEFDNPRWNNHIDLSSWADLFIIAPATSNIIASMANAICNNLIIAVYLSSTCPVFVAPSMDLDMFKHPANKKNISKLIDHGDNVLPVGEGFLASGLEGKGRMMEPEFICDNIISFFQKKKKLLNKKILITAGPTHEPIDPVRFIGNRSSGKMGFELAKEAFELGGEVILIIGPNNLDLNSFKGKIINVSTAEDMFKKTIVNFKNTDILISAAAVSDFRPKSVDSKKIKKITKVNEIPLEPTIDILNEIAKIKKNQIVIGFALETDNEFENAKIKLENKNLDAIVLNSLNDKSAGFNFNTNKITFIKKNGKAIKFNLKTKKEVAKDILNQILEIYE